MTDPAPDTGPSTEVHADQPKRFLFLRRRTQADPAEPQPDATAPDAPEVPADAADAGPERVRPGVLRRRRRQLEDAYQQAIFDLGGLAMELHSRGLLAEDVMRRKAAEVSDVRQQLDDLGARLDEIRQERQERRQAGRRAGVTCPSCGARNPAGARFCMSCGAALTTTATEDPHGPAEQGAEQVTTVIAVEETVVVEADPQPTAAIPPAGRDEG